MSEFHPNRTKQVRTRPKLTTRRILECWPVLVWIAIGAAAYFIYRGGVIFVRMNGAVDVYQENITPINKGRLLEIKVKRGDKVPPGTIVAIMDQAPYKLELDSLKREIVADRRDDINDYGLELYKLESDLRDIQTAEAEDAATINELEDVVEGTGQPAANLSPEMQQLMQRWRNASTDILRAKVDLAKAKGRSALTAQHLSQIGVAIKSTKAVRTKLEEEATLLAKSDVTFEEITKAAALRADEEKLYTQLKTKIDQCQLITPHGGTVDRLDKEPGEFVDVGEGVLKIVGDPEQVVCFLPQDQVNDLTMGKKVWIASTSDKSLILESVVTGISPRINNLADATSPLPNRRVHGRDIVVQYPADAKPATKDEPFKLLPGQTVIVHLEKPGKVPWIDRLFHNDDNDTVR